MPAKRTSAQDESHIREAALVLRAGGIVAFPTETVYGLGADAFNAVAVAKVFEAKRRPSFDPLIVHVADPKDTVRLWREVPPAAQKLMDAFWPGPLTLVLPKKDELPGIVTADLDTVAVRMPRNDAALALIRALGSPIAAPSANVFGYTSATSADAVMEDLGDKIDIVLDGGPAAIGVESTVLKIEQGRAVLLRPGGTPVEEIKKYISVDVPAASAAVESPGQTPSHYAPWTPFVASELDYPDIQKQLERLHKLFAEKEKPWPRIGILLFGERKESPLFANMECLSAKKNLNEAAAHLFGAIRKLDKMNLDLIVAENVPEKGLGLAIRDRLSKAAAGKRAVDSFFDNLLQ